MSSELKSPKDCAKKILIGDISNIADCRFMESLPVSLTELAKVKLAGNITLLHMAAANNETIVALKLIEHGADVNAQSTGKYTPLHYAESPEMVDLLLDNGAVINESTEIRFNVAELAYLAHNYPKLYTLLSKKGTDSRRIKEWLGLPLESSHSEIRMKLENDRMLTWFE